MWSFLADQSNKKKQIFIEIVNGISFHRCLAKDNFVLLFDNTFSYLLHMMFYQNSRFKSHLIFFEKQGEIKSNFFKYTYLRAQIESLVGSIWCWPNDSIWACCEVWLKSYFQFHLLWQNSFCIIPCFKSAFSEIIFCVYCFIYTCALFCHFLGSIFTKKGYYLRKQGFD